MPTWKNYFVTRLRPDTSRDVVWSSIARYLQRYVPLSGTVLDLGAGYCSFINNIHAKERHAVDISSLVKRHASPGVRTWVRACDDLRVFQQGSVDVVFASNLFEHLTRESLDKTIQEIFRVLKKRGTLILVQPNFRYAYREYFDDYTHLLIFTHLSLCDLLASHGFRIQHCTPRFLPFSMRSRLPKSRFLVWLYLHSPIKPFASQMLIVASKPG